MMHVTGMVHLCLISWLHVTTHKVRIENALIGGPGSGKTYKCKSQPTGQLSHNWRVWIAWLWIKQKLSKKMEFLLRRSMVWCIQHGAFLQNAFYDNGASVARAYELFRKRNCLTRWKTLYPVGIRRATKAIQRLSGVWLAGVCTCNYLEPNYLTEPLRGTDAISLVWRLKLIVILTDRLIVFQSDTPWYRWILWYVDILMIGAGTISLRGAWRIRESKKIDVN